MSGKLYLVGLIVNTHGIRGELKILSRTDFPELRFAKGSKLVFVHPETGAQVPVTVDGARQQKGLYLVRFNGWDNINQVEKFKGWQVKVEEQYLAELDEGEYYVHQIVGCRVTDREGRHLGEVTEVLYPGANHVWVVSRGKGKKPWLLPVIDDVVKNVDVANKLITIEPMEGLIDE